MKSRILILVCALFLWGGCHKENWQLFPDSGDYKTIEVKGTVLSHTDQRPVGNIRLANRRCDVIFGDCTDTGCRGVTNMQGEFKFNVNIYYWHTNYLALVGIDSLYERGGYVNGDFVYDLVNGGISLQFPSNEAYTNTFKIELIAK